MEELTRKQPTVYAGTTLSIEDLIERSSLIFLDVCILQCRPTNKRYGTEGCFSKYLGKSRDFSELKMLRLSREEGYVCRLNYLLENSKNFTSTTECLTLEHKKLIDHIERVTKYHLRHASKKRGEKSLALKRIIDYHKENCKILLKRSKKNLECNKLTRFLIESEMNTPYLNLNQFQKHYHDLEKISEIDASLVSSAFTEACNEKYDKPIIIITADNDIINIVGNLGDYINSNHQENNPISIKPVIPVEAYFPYGKGLFKVKLNMKHNPQERTEFLFEREYYLRQRDSAN